MSYRRPVLRPVRCNTRKESSSTPCNGEPRSRRTSGLPILTRAGGGTDRFRLLVIAQHLLHVTLPRAGRCARGVGHLTGASHLVVRRGEGTLPDCDDHVIVKTPAGGYRPWSRFRGTLASGWPPPVRLRWRRSIQLTRSRRREEDHEQTHSSHGRGGPGRRTRLAGLSAVLPGLVPYLGCPAR